MGATVSDRARESGVARAATRQAAPATDVVEVPMKVAKVLVELPMEVVERVFPLLPACTLLRSRAVCR